MPKMDRRPAFRKIADHYRDLILSGELQPGDALPSVTELMREWQVSRDTAAKAIGHLQGAKLVWTSHRGTFVEDKERNARSPRERAQLRRPAATTEVVTVHSAATVMPPGYVAEIFSLPPRTLVIRREETAVSRDVTTRLTVDWITSPSGQVDCGHLLQPEPIEGGSLACLERATGRRVSSAQDSWEGRAATERESRYLGLPAGSPVLAIVTLFYDGAGDTLMYQETAMRPGIALTAEYDLEPDPE